MRRKAMPDVYQKEVINIFLTNQVRNIPHVRDKATLYKKNKNKRKQTSLFQFNSNQSYR